MTTLTLNSLGAAIFAASFSDGTNNYAGRVIVDPATGLAVSPASSVSNTTGGTSIYSALGGTGNALLTNTATAR